MPNPICHFEIGVRDQKKAGEFYAKVFDWKLEPAPHGTMLRTGVDVSGHLSTLGHEPHNYTIFYVMVDDLAATIAKVTAAGGKKLLGPVPMDGGKSEFAWIADLEGNTIGVYAERKQ